MTDPTEFQPWPKIARLNRDIVITEKIDGTNAAILITKTPVMEWAAEGNTLSDQDPLLIHGHIDLDAGFVYHVYAQSRTRFITPGKGTDNYGFAGWAAENAETLVDILGPGRHFGEWWGAGIQRKYGVDQKYFSLFDVTRWHEDFNPGVRSELERVRGLEAVPILYRGPFSQMQIDVAIEDLRNDGSIAAPNFPAEGIVVWHTAARTSFKVTLEGDASPKGPAGHVGDLELAA